MSSDLLERPIYDMPQVDRLLALKPGTARRWIDGYERAGKRYPPVIRLEHTGSDIVTWGEFVETRFLAEYREKGIPLVRMRPAIEQLRKEYDTKYPLASIRPFTSGKELVYHIQKQVDLERPLYLVVLRNNQLLLAPAAGHFMESVSADDEGDITRLRPLPSVEQVVIDPLRQFGDPVVRSVPTSIIAEQVRAGDRLEMIAELYELPLQDVEAAVRYELLRGQAA
jgi:uncharacterized protein (DUF433 family)